MGFDEIYKILEAIKTNPIQTAVIIGIMVVVAMVTVFLKNYLSEKGKQAASGAGSKQTAPSNHNYGEQTYVHHAIKIITDNPPYTKKKPWYDSPGWIIFWIILFWPIGVLALYMGSSAKLAWKITIGIIVLVIVLMGIILVLGGDSGLQPVTSNQPR